MRWAPDSPDLWAPDSATANRWAADSGAPLTLGRGVELFLAAKAAEGAAAKTLEWYRMILLRAARSLGDQRPLDGLSRPELREWILGLRSTLAPISVAGFVRTLKVFGNWLAAEELAEATALRSLRKPRVPDKLVEPVGDDVLRRLLAIASLRDRAILLLLLDTGLRVSEAASLRLGDLSPRARSRSTARAPRSGSCQWARPHAERSSATWDSAASVVPTRRSFLAIGDDSMPAASSRLSGGSRRASASPAG